MISRALWCARSCAVVMLAGLCGVAVLAGCTADAAGEPTTLPDVSPAPTASSPSVPSPTPTPTPTPTVEPPVEPANAHEETAEGVEVFTLYAIDVINYASGTNDVRQLKAIMTSDCGTCERAVASLEALAADGGRLEGGRMIVEYISVQPPAEGVRPGAVADITVTASKTYDGSGTVTESEKEELLQFVFFLEREESVWKLDGIEPGQGEPASPQPSPSS